jgi:hypothetical protein
MVESSFEALNPSQGRGSRLSRTPGWPGALGKLDQRRAATDVLVAVFVEEAKGMHRQASIQHNVGADFVEGSSLGCIIICFRRGDD